MSEILNIPLSLRYPQGTSDPEAVLRQELAGTLDCMQDQILALPNEALGIMYFLLDMAQDNPAISAFIFGGPLVEYLYYRYSRELADKRYLPSAQYFLSAELIITLITSPALLAQDLRYALARIVPVIGGIQNFCQQKWKPSWLRNFWNEKIAGGINACVLGLNMFLGQFHTFDDVLLSLGSATTSTAAAIDMQERTILRRIMDTIGNGCIAFGGMRLGEHFLSGGVEQEPHEIAKIVSGLAIVSIYFQVRHLMESISLDEVFAQALQDFSLER